MKKDESDSVGKNQSAGTSAAARTTASKNIPPICQRLA